MENTIDFFARTLPRHGFKITVTHAGIIVHGDLDLSKMDLEFLPEGLAVLGDLILDKSAVAELPERLFVLGDLYLRNGCVEHIPETAIIGGSIILTLSNIRTLPDNFIVNGDLDVSRTELEMAPSVLEVRGQLKATGLLRKDIEQAINAAAPSASTAPAFSQKVVLVSEDGFTRVTHVKKAQPAGQYVPTAVDAAKRASDFVIVDIGDKYGIRWKGGRYEQVTEAKLNKLKLAHSWTTDF